MSRSHAPSAAEVAAAEAAAAAAAALDVGANAADVPAQPSLTRQKGKLVKDSGYNARLYTAPAVVSDPSSPEIPPRDPGGAAPKSN